MIKIQRCIRCNKLLTGDKARERGMGRVCFKKFQAERARDKERNSVLEEFL